MTTRLRLAALSLLLAPLAGCSMYLAEARVDYRQSVDVAGIQRVVLETRNGSIEVQCDAGRKDVDIQATKFSRGATVEEAREYADEIQITAERDPVHPDTLRIVADWPHEQPMRSRGASFRLSMPPDAAFELKTSNGHVTAVRAAGDVSIQTSNGRVTARDIGGAVHAQSSNGAILLNAIAGDVDVRTSNGSIQIDRAGRNSVRAISSNGTIHALQTSGNAYVRTNNGSVELRVASVSTRPEITAISSNGRVLVETPAQISARLRMRTSNGAVRAELRESTPMREIDTGRSHFYATLNDGMGQISIESSNGSVTFQTQSTAAPPPAAQPVKEG